MMNKYFFIIALLFVGAVHAGGNESQPLFFQLYNACGTDIAGYKGFAHGMAPAMVNSMQKPTKEAKNFYPYDSTPEHNQKRVDHMLKELQKRVDRATEKLERVIDEKASELGVPEEDCSRFKKLITIKPNSDSSIPTGIFQDMLQSQTDKGSCDCSLLSIACALGWTLKMPPILGAKYVEGNTEEEKSQYSFHNFFVNEGMTRKKRNEQFALRMGNLAQRMEAQENKIDPEAFFNVVDMIFRTLEQYKKPV